jgi:transcription antitermination factor NusG
MGKLINKMSGTVANLRRDIVINQLLDDEKRWFAVYTKYKCEKYVADHLKKKNIEVYLPLMSKTLRYSRKIKHIELPLINCYVFVCIDKKQYIPTLETEYVMKFLRQGKDLLSIPESEMDMLKRVAGDVEDVIPVSEMVYDMGEEVEVVSGQLAGMIGRIVSKAGKKSFVVELNTIGFQFRINIDLKLLRPLVNKLHIA